MEYTIKGFFDIESSIQILIMANNGEMLKIDSVLKEYWTLISRKYSII